MVCACLLLSADHLRTSGACTWNTVQTRSACQRRKQRLAAGQLADRTPERASGPVIQSWWPLMVQRRRHSHTSHPSDWKTILRSSLSIDLDFTVVTVQVTLHRAVPPRLAVYEPSTHPHVRAAHHPPCSPHQRSSWLDSSEFREHGHRLLIHRRALRWRSRLLAAVLRLQHDVAGQLTFDRWHLGHTIWTRVCATTQYKTTQQPEFSQQMAGYVDVRVVCQA